MVTPSRLFGYQEHVPSCAFGHSFKPRKNIPVLVGTTHKKTEYPEMRRTYAQQQKKAPSRIFLLTIAFITIFIDLLYDRIECSNPQFNFHCMKIVIIFCIL